LGRDRQCIISIYRLQWSDIFLSSCVARSIVGYLASACLSSGASANRGFVFRFFSACLLYPSFCDAAQYLYRRLAEHGDHVVQRNFLRRMSEKERDGFLLPVFMVLWANLHGRPFLLGFLILGIFCGVALLKRDWANFQDLQFLRGQVCFVAIFINPLGWHIYGRP